MATALCDFGCSGTVELPAPNTVRHNCPVHTAKALETFPVFLRPQERKVAFRAYRPVFKDVFSDFIYSVTAGTY